MKERLKSFRKFFTELKLWEKLKGYAQKIGVKAVYMVLLMYYSYKRKDTPGFVKRIILGTLGYFIALIDFMPDPTPIIGMTDDITVLAIGLGMIAAYVNDEVRDKAKQELKLWFGDIDESIIDAVDKELDQKLESENQ